MATNQIEEACISRQRNKVLGAIIERYPDSNLYVEGDGCELRVGGEGLTDCKRLDGKHFGAECTSNELDTFKTPTLGETSVVVRNYTAGRETIIRGGAVQVTDLPVMTVITVWKEQR